MTKEFNKSSSQKAVIKVDTIIKINIAALWKLTKGK